MEGGATMTLTLYSFLSQWYPTQRVRTGRHFLGPGLLSFRDLWGSGRGHLNGMRTSAYQWPLLDSTGRHFLGPGLLSFRELWGSGRGHLNGMRTSAYQWPLLDNDPIVIPEVIDPFVRTSVLGVY
jgi:hypothetical protein